MSQVATAHQTPMLKQYLEIKAGHQDAILFFRLGDFYEMFLEDAKLASKELELTLTGRGKDDSRIPMCGVPYHAAEQYIARLISKGFKVAICEQVEDPTTSIGLTKREVVRVITPGTVLNAGSVDEKDNNYLVAVQLLPRTQVGVSFVDLTTGEFRLTVCETHDEAKRLIQQLSPKEVILPENQEWALPEGCLANRSRFLETERAESELCRFFKVQALSGLGIGHYHAAVPCAWTLIEYAQATARTGLSQLVTLKEWHSHFSLRMDGVTIQNLELIQSRDRIQKTATLFSVLDFTKTAMGARKLRQAILHPLVSIQACEERLDAVQSLKTDLLSREEIRDTLSAVYDLERLVSRIVSGLDNPKDLLALGVSLVHLEPIAIILPHLEAATILSQMAAYFSTAFEQGSSLKKLEALIKQAIREDAPITIRDGQVIKPGYSEELDTLLLSFQNVREWIASLEERERQHTGIRSLKVGFNKVFGYYIEVPNSQVASVPAHYIRKQTLANAERYITPDLKEQEAILLNGESKQVELEKALYAEVVDAIKQEACVLQDLASHVAWLDFYQSLATAAQKYQYVRPQFVAEEERILEIEQGRHPVLERSSSQQFTPNSIRMSRDKNRFMLITGPNMAGKSTLMRQAALLVVMAQLGSFVAADAMKLSPVDQIFTRIGALDNLYFGQSTFMVEMLETASILNNATSKSLIVLDEIGRGTSTFDGMSLAGAVAEHIHTQLQSRTLFATHYHELTVLESQCEGFANFCMHIAETDGKIVFTHLFKKGTADKSYGIHVAQMAGLPEPVIRRAQEFLQGFEDHGMDFLKKSNIHQLSLFD